MMLHISLAKNEWKALGLLCLYNTEKKLLSYVVCNTIILWLNIVFYCEKIIVYSLWSLDPDSSKQKMKTIDFQAVCLSIDYDFKDGIFLHYQC